MLKEQLLSKSLTSHALDEDELKELVKRSVTYLSTSADLPTAAIDYLDQAYNVQGVMYVCEEVTTGVYDWVTHDTSGQALHYPDASGKPTLDGITLNGPLTKSSLGIAPATSTRSEVTSPTSEKILLNDDKYITYSELESVLASSFGITLLSKLEKYSNPLLTSNGTICPWEIDHTCNTSTPLVQLFTSGGILVQSGINLIQHSGVGRISIQINSAVDISANSYYIILIG